MADWAHRQVAEEVALQAIASILSNHMGLRVDSLGQARVAKTIMQVGKASGFVAAADYLHHLQTSSGAIDALVEAIVVPETSFFRNPESFVYLRRYLSQQRSPNQSPLEEVANPAKSHPEQSVWRVLSIPCSTGEEPYSIAMTFRDAGLPADSVHVDAVDISAKALEKAQRGRFHAYSFRRTATYSPERHIAKYFRREGARYVIGEQLRSQVSFFQASLTSPLCLQGQGPYDIVFCRNLLIYLHQTARDRAFKNLDRLLRPGGLLFVGYAETNQVNLQRFASVSEPQVFAYRKLTNQQSYFAPQKLAPHKKEKADLVRNFPGKERTEDLRKESPSLKPVLPEIEDNSQHSVVSVDILTESRLLADSGQIEAALVLCDRYLKANPTEALAYLLLGEIYQAQSNYDRAEDAFKKAIYLNPNCTDALLHRILLLEKKEDYQSAQQLRLRLNRLDKRKDTSHTDD